MARDPDTIQREIERSRDALAESLDALSDRASPKRLAADSKQSLQAKLAQPAVRYTLIAVGAVVALAVLRKLFR